MFQLLRSLLFVIILLNTYSLFGQQTGTTVEGRIIDSAGINLEGATIRLYRAKDSVALSMVTTAKDGYLFRKVQPGPYRLVISFAGYETISFLADIQAKRSQTLEPIRLKRDYRELENVVIQSTPPPITTRGDTLVYRADAFPVRANSSLEALLRKLPGIEVADDGSITYQGKRIEKIYINGKDYYLDDPRLLSQNLAADIISRIELFDMPLTSKEALKPVSERSKALDLKLKKGANLGLMGKVYAAATPTGKVGAGASAQSFSNGRVLMGGVNSNSYNDLFKGGNEMELITGMGIIPQGKSTHTNAFIFGNKVLGKTRVGGNYAQDNRRAENDVYTDKLTFLADSSLLESTNNSSYSNSRMYLMMGSVELMRDSGLGTISFSPAIRLSSSKNSSSNRQVTYARKPGVEYMLNEGTSSNSSSIDGMDISGTIGYMKTFRRRTIGMTLSGSDDGNESSGSINNSSGFFNAAGDIIASSAYDQQFTGKEKRKNFLVSVQDREMLSKSTSVNINYSFLQIRNLRERYSYNYNSATQEYDKLDSLSTFDFKSVTRQHRFTGNFNQEWKQFTFMAGLAYSHQQLINDDLFKSERMGKLEFSNLLPEVTIKYGKRQSNINLAYNMNVRPPQVDQIRPVTDRSNPFLIRVGSPDLKQQRDHQFILNYLGSSPKRMQFVNINISAGFSNNSIVSFTNILPGGVQETGWINRDGGYFVRFHPSYQVAIGKKRKTNIRVMGGLSYTKDFTVTNGVDNQRKMLSINPDVEIALRGIKKVELKMRAAYNYNATRFTVQPGFNTPQKMQKYTFNGKWELPLELLLSANYSATITGSQSVVKGTTVQQLNAYISMNVLKKKRGEIRLAGYDLLNTATGIAQYAYDNYISTVSNNTIGRQFLLAFTWNFR